MQLLAGWSLTFIISSRHDGEYKALGCYRTQPVGGESQDDTRMKSTHSEGRDLVRTSYLIGMHILSCTDPTPQLPSQIPHYSSSRRFGSEMLTNARILKGIPSRVSVLSNYNHPQYNTINDFFPAFPLVIFLSVGYAGC